MRSNPKIGRESKPRAELPLDLIRHPRMTDRIRALLLELAGFAWGQSAICWPSNATIAKGIGKHADTVRDILAEAEALGFIIRVGGSRRTIVLRWKLRSGWALSPTPAQETATPSQAKAPPESLNQKRGKKKHVAVVGQATQGPPPTDDQAGEKPAVNPASAAPPQRDEQASASELVAMARQVLDGGPLASFYRAALALSGITTDEAIQALVEAETPTMEESEFFQGPAFEAQSPPKRCPGRQMASSSTEPDSMLPRASQAASSWNKTLSGDGRARLRRRRRNESIQRLGEILPSVFSEHSQPRLHFPGWRE